jgi:hypothetical protein
LQDVAHIHWHSGSFEAGSIENIGANPINDLEAKRGAFFSKEPYFC